MNPKTAAVATALLALSIQHVAAAQGTVTLYGIIDHGIAYVNRVASESTAPSASRVSAVAGFGSGNRFGLIGKEPLGGGLRAIFTLENGFNGFNGAALQGGKMFGRQAFVGLESDTFGTVTLGRQYDFNLEYLAPFLAWLQFGSIYGAHIGDVDNTFASFRHNNMAKYQFTPLAGLKLGAFYSFSNQAAGPQGAGFANNRAYGMGATYKHGDWSAALTWLHLSNPSASSSSNGNPNGAVGDGYASATGLFYNLGFVQRQSVYGAALGYQMRKSRINFAVTHTRLAYDGGRDIRVVNYELNGRYSVTPALMLGAAYIFTNANGYTGVRATAIGSGNHPKWHQVDLGATYSLSKRTDIHMSCIYQRAAGDAQAVALNVLGQGGAGATSQLALVTGLRHRF
ncbi:porin [Burkholderia sp. BCC1998]|uniref:porin n=1 Tax=Burkholderia sp. BCC1998 TaxID=2817447 RepID=UPI002AB67188|nr:porin [Burkholderia sp. BCC1998]